MASEFNLQPLIDASDRTTKSLDGLIKITTDSVMAQSELATVIKTRLLPTGPTTQNGNNKNLLFAMGALMFGLMAPMYIMLSSNTDSISGINETMKGDHGRERVVVAELATLRESLRTQFRSVNGLMGLRDEGVARRIKTLEDAATAHDMRVIGLNAAQWERIYGLEEDVKGKPGRPGPGTALGGGY